MSTYESVDGLDIELADGVLTLRLARPDKRNALNDTMVYAAIGAVDLAGRDETVRAILLTSAGEHFCSGFDWVARNQETKESGSKPRAGSIQRRLPSQAHRLIPLLCTVQSSGIRRCACDGNRRWMLPARGLLPVSLASWLRATQSKPEQKCSPAPVSRMARTASSRPARSTASMAA